MPSPLSKDNYEAIVVGSGFGGAVAACRLAQAGVDVAILDIRPLNDVLVVQAAGYGGGSLIYANVQMRPPSDVFDDGWPPGYPRAALDPHYDLVAHMLEIRPVEPDPATGELPRKTRLMAATRLGRGAQSFRPKLAVRFDGAGEPAGGATQVELWENPRPSAQRLRLAERLAIAGRVSGQPGGRVASHPCADV
jgi:cholesterol oxidase